MASMGSVHYSAVEKIFYADNSRFMFQILLCFDNIFLLTTAWSVSSL